MRLNARAPTTRKAYELRAAHCAIPHCIRILQSHCEVARSAHMGSSAQCMPACRAYGRAVRMWAAYAVRLHAVRSARLALQLFLYGQKCKRRGAYPGRRGAHRVPDRGSLSRMSAQFDTRKKFFQLADFATLTFSCAWLTEGCAEETSDDPAE